MLHIWGKRSNVCDWSLAWFVTFAAVPVVCKMLRTFYAFKTPDFNDNLELSLKKKKRKKVGMYLKCHLTARIVEPQLKSIKIEVRKTQFIWKDLFFFLWWTCFILLVSKAIWGFCGAEKSVLMSDCQASSLHQNKMIVTLKNKHTFKWCKKRQKENVFHSGALQ